MIMTENMRKNFANAISIARPILAAILILWFVASGGEAQNWAFAIFWIAIAATDAVDGMVARSKIR